MIHYNGCFSYDQESGAAAASFKTELGYFLVCIMVALTPLSNFLNTKFQ